MTKIKSRAPKSNQANTSLLPHSVTLKTLAEEFKSSSSESKIIKALSAAIKEAELSDEITDLKLSILYDLLYWLMGNHSIKDVVLVHNLFDSRLRSGNREKISLEEKKGYENPTYVILALNDLILECDFIWKEGSKSREHLSTLRHLRDYLIKEEHSQKVFTQFQELLA